MLAMAFRPAGMRCLAAPARKVAMLSCSSVVMRQSWAARAYSSAPQATPTPTPTRSTRNREIPTSVSIRGTNYDTDPSWLNVSANVLDKTSRQLHLQPDHPISITRQIIESHFPQPAYKYYNEHSPVVSKLQNFDSLGFPSDHPGRSRSDTYYIDQNTLLRTHTSAHQADTFRANESDGYLISADVYRRDTVDRSHYPAFHQMEGARSWNRDTVPGGDIAAAVRQDIEKLPKHNVTVEEPNPSFNKDSNPLQEGHSTAEVEAVGAHLRRSLENVVVDIFSRAKAAAMEADPDFVDEPLQMRWIEAYFPFTSPSWELEVYFAGAWLEVVGCGVVKQDLYNNAGVPSRVGWAFGVGMDRLAMLLFNIPDIRLFWSEDPRFISQFKGVSGDLAKLKRFAPFSKYPGSVRDVSFWLPSPSAAEGPEATPVHTNDVMEIVRSIAGDLVEDVVLFDEFTHPKTGRKSMAYRVMYRSLEKTVTREAVNEVDAAVRAALAKELGVELRDK